MYYINKCFRQELKPIKFHTKKLSIIFLLYVIEIENGTIERGKEGMTIIDEYRFQLFRRKVASSKQEVGLDHLPPTHNAGSEHMLRVYHQISK